MNGIVPARLDGYRQALEEAIRRDLAAGRARRRRRVAVRAVLAVAVVAAVALGMLSIVSRPASGASVVRRAAAAIARSPGRILHVDMVGSQTNADGSVVTWRDESWQQESPPYARRQVETGPVLDRLRAEEEPDAASRVVFPFAGGARSLQLLRRQVVERRGVSAGRGLTRSGVFVEALERKPESLTVAPGGAARAAATIPVLR